MAVFSSMYVLIGAVSYHGYIVEYAFKKKKLQTPSRSRYRNERQNQCRIILLLMNISGRPGITLSNPIQLSYHQKRRQVSRRRQGQLSTVTPYRHLPIWWPGEPSQSPASHFHHALILPRRRHKFGGVRGRVARVSPEGQR